MATGGVDGDYAALIADLAAFRNDRLQRRPSDRTLAKAADVRPTTVGDRLRGARFPQQIEPLLRVVRAVRAQAERAGLSRDPAAASLFDEQRWRDAYQAEARRRANATRTHVLAEQAHTVLEGLRPGRPLAQVTDPFQLEVHRAIEVGDATGLPQLPRHVPREHDRRLAQVVQRAAAGTSALAVLVGGSSTGKTRACWEALHLLRDRDEPWRLWHPIDPTRPDAVLADIGMVGPYTVVWLNEAQFYLADDALGERVAAGLRELLRDPDRGPVLVLATLWPNHWATLTTRTDPDRHAQARELLDGHDIRVPDAFSETDLKALAEHSAEDPRLREAARYAADGQITQYLAGVPVLMHRYTHAPPITKALIHAAMDARRLGAGPHLPLALLADAAPGYLTDTEWEQTGEDWLERALEYVTTPCNGIPGILVPIKTGTPRNRRTRRAGLASARTGPADGHGPRYRLADYLEQHGRRTRADEIPPIDFWTAAAAHAPRADQAALGRAARSRGLYRDAAQLLKNAATQGDTSAGAALVSLMHAVHPTDRRPAGWVATQVPLTDMDGVSLLLDGLREARADEQLAALLARDPAAQVDISGSGGVLALLRSLRAAGAGEQEAALLGRVLDRSEPVVRDAIEVAWQLDHLRELGAHERVMALLARDPAARVDIRSGFALTWLLESLRKVGAEEQAAVLAGRIIAEFDLRDASGVAWLLERFRATGAAERLSALLARNPAARVDIGEAHHVATLLEKLRAIGAHQQVAVLTGRIAAEFDLPDAAGTAVMLAVLKEFGTDRQVAALPARDPAARVELRDAFGLVRLLDGLRAVGAVEQAAVLTERIVGEFALHDASGVDWLLDALRESGAHEAVAALLARNPAAHVDLDDALGVARFLSRLRTLGADEQVAVLLDRDPAAKVCFDSPLGGIVLFRTLRALGADEQAALLVRRLPAAGRFDEFLDVDDHRERFRFGREPDGSPAGPWSWDDLR